MTALTMLRPFRAIRRAVTMPAFALQAAALVSLWLILLGRTTPTLLEHFAVSSPSLRSWLRQATLGRDLGSLRPQPISMLAFARASRHLMAVPRWKDRLAGPQSRSRGPS